MVKNLPANAGDMGSIPEWGRSPGGGCGNPLQYSGLENPMDRGAWWGYSPQDCKQLDTTEHQRTDAFELLCWRGLLRVPWTARRSNQSILKDISPEYSLEGLMLKLKLQYFLHLMRRANSLENTLMLARLKAGGEGDDRG